ncbi:MAG: hypothetical protein MJY58_02890 [Bacteroidaceae bacterium]|nr:hypothetical protein [Bacteroidaceae bacterium]
MKALFNTISLAVLTMGLIASCEKHEIPLDIQVSGPEYVEITMEIGGETKIYKWAKCNIGATSETDYGTHFAWGDITGWNYTDTTRQASFDWEHCPFNGGHSDYESTVFNGIKDSICPGGTLALMNDVANRTFGGTWRMPTKEEFDALCKLSHSWKNNYNNTGTNGCLFTDRNGNSVFFPANGFGDGSNLISVGESGYCWSSSLSTVIPSTAAYLGIADAGASYTSFEYRCIGKAVRPISE